MAKLFKPKMPKIAPSPRPVTRDDARDTAALEDEVRIRRGGAADILTASTGAEAGAGGKSILG